MACCLSQYLVIESAKLLLSLNWEQLISNYLGNFVGSKGYELSDVAGGKGKNKKKNKRG